MFLRRWIRLTPKRLGTFQVDSFPDFSASEKKNTDTTFTYCMLGSTTVMGAVMAKNLAHDYLVNKFPSKDILALNKIEVDLTTIPLGKNLMVQWRGKPVYIRHRTPDEIAEAASVALTDLPHQELDSERFKVPHWLVVVGICTHLGCVPVGEAGEYNGWYCPCHGSHYDISGRIRKGPAPLNLPVPPCEFLDNNSRLIIG